ncbi:MAG: hypothetical protein ACREAW_07955 [Nitrososphaera sp.]
MSEKVMCILCEKTIEDNKPIIERINGIEYIFDKEECALTFNKLKSVYGNDFCLIFAK